MSKLIYITNMSLDGYIEDERGAFNWENADRVHPFAAEVLRPIGTYLYGRRLYETMAYWDSPVEDYPPEYRAFARIWQKAGKIVFSRTLSSTTTRNTRIERNFDPEAILKLKRESELDISIGGAELAGLALESALVDECHVFLHPLILGGGKPAFGSGSQWNLELADARSLDAGIVHLHYRTRERRRPQI